MDENKIIPYVEPIYRFCCKRLSNHHDAEDLAGEIIYYVLDGMKKYKIESFDAWVWRIAHNRYARFVDTQNRSQMILAGEDLLVNVASPGDSFDEEESVEQEYETVFRYLHELSFEYRKIFVDYYIGEMSIRELARKYSLSEATVKWRLNVGREKIKKWIGEKSMDKVYKRINWNTTCCNGSVDTDRYLHKQIARAICLAAYEKPLTVEEISLRTGIPAMYIEDELSELEFGEAVCKIGNKYAANFIIFRLQDRERVEGVSALLVKYIADKLEVLLDDRKDSVERLDFYGHDFGVERLGYFLIPYLLRRRIGTLKSQRLNLANGSYPPRMDSGYGWFIVEETDDENENCGEYNTGCNVAGDDSQSKSEIPSHIYYYWISKYFDPHIYHGMGTHWLCGRGIPQKSKDDGIITKSVLLEEDAASLIQRDLIVKSGNDYKLNFACFTEEQFQEFVALFELDDGQLDDMLAEWIMTVRKSFGKFVPERLEDQINQWVSGYLYQIVGYVTDELIRRGILRRPDPQKPLTDGVFYVEGKDIDP